MAEYDAPPPPPEADEEYKKVTDINHILALRKSEDIPNKKNFDARVSQLLSSQQMKATQPTALLQAPEVTGGRSKAKPRTKSKGRSKSKTRAQSKPIAKSKGRSKK